MSGAGPASTGPGASAKSVRSCGGGQRPGAAPTRTAAGAPSSTMHQEGPHQRSAARIVERQVRLMNRQSAGLRRGPIEIQPGSSMKASAQTEARTPWYSGRTGSTVLKLSGRGRFRRPFGPEDTVAARQAFELDL